MVWEGEVSASAVQVLEGYHSNITGIAVSTDGARVLSCSEDGMVEIWDISTGLLANGLWPGLAVYCVAIVREIG